MKKLLSNLIPLTNHAIVRILMQHEGPRAQLGERGAAAPKQRLQFHQRIVLHLSFYPGPLAQLGERVNGIHEVSGSIPLRSTSRSLKRKRKQKRRTPYHVRLFFVGAGRFELPTSWSRTKRSSRAEPRPVDNSLRVKPLPVINIRMNA